MRAIRGLLVSVPVAGSGHGPIRRRLPTARVLAVIDNEVRDLRKRQAIESFKADEHHRFGTYWGIRNHVADYELSSSLGCPPKRTEALARTKSSLKKLDELRQRRRQLGLRDL